MSPTSIALFEENLVAAGGRLLRAGIENVADTVFQVVRSDGLVLMTPELPGLARGLARAGIDARVGVREQAPGPEIAENLGVPRDFEALLRRADCGVVMGIAGVAASGSVLVGPGGGNGGLLVSLPPRTVILLDESHVLPTLSDALTEAALRFAGSGGEFVLVTGPSRTADIEMMSVIGVHGPLEVDVILVDVQGA